LIRKARHPFAAADLQAANKAWWTQQPMQYDWHGTNAAAEGTYEFYAEVDRRFFGASPFYAGDRPFAELIPYHKLAHERVLEIGCGQGSHTQLLAQTGADVTAIDITARAVALTKRRLALANLLADVREMDAERMEFRDGEFGFVWSWGVIHHSAHTDRIVREVARVLKPGGEFRFMVYNRRALDSYVKLLRGALTGKSLRGMSGDDILSFYTDGYLARFFTRSSLTKLITDNGLVVRAISVLGQKSELLPLPGTGVIGRLKYGLLSRIPDAFAKGMLSATGSFLFASAQRPVRPNAEEAG
jgi:2-polyprenyl-3-methyl-5-hydroxy-6-metoxy-1,4-benzoquinol methylase